MTQKKRSPSYPAPKEIHLKMCEAKDPKAVLEKLTSAPIIEFSYESGRHVPRSGISPSLSLPVPTAYLLARKPRETYVRTFLAKRVVTTANGAYVTISDLG